MSVIGHRQAVLIVTSTPKASGVVSYVTALAQVLSTDIYAIGVPPGSDLGNGLPMSAPTEPLLDGRLGMAKSLAAYKHEFAAIQTHGPRALLAARLARVPVRSLNHVFHEFPSPRRRRSWVELASARGVHRTCNTWAVAERMQRLGLSADVLPPVVAPPAFVSRAQAREQLGISNDTLAAGVVGRLSAAKFPALAVEAVAEASADLPERPHLYFVGEGPLGSAVRNMARSQDVPMTLLGSIATAASFLRAFDVVVVPSPRETFCLTLAEAALADVPVAAVRSSGSSLLSDDGRLLPLAAPDPRSLGRAVVSALRQPEAERTQLRHHIESRFGVEAGRDRYEAHFRALLRPASKPD